MKRCPTLAFVTLIVLGVMIPSNSYAGVEDILGKWVAKAVTPNGPIELQLEIKMEGDQLVGAMAGLQGSVPLSNLKFEDPDLSLEATLAGTTFKLTGTLKDGKFAGNYEQVGADLKGIWTAERKASSAAAADPAEIAGAWASVAVTPHGDLTVTLDLKQEGDKVTGSVSSETGALPIQAASFKENMLQFDVVFGGNRYHIEALLKDGKLSGQWSSVGGSDSGAWSATRKIVAPAPSAAAASLDGTWNSVALTPDGDNIVFVLELKQAGENVTGNAVAPDGKIPIQKATFVNSVLTFDIQYSGSTYRIQANMESGKLTGKWSAINGQETGSWSATRKSP